MLLLLLSILIMQVDMIIGGRYMFLSVKKVAELFHVSEVTVYRWAKNGKIPSFNVGGVIRFDYDEIMEYIRKGVDEK